MVPVAFLLSPYWKFSFKGGGTVSLLHAGNRKSTQVGYPEATTFFFSQKHFPLYPSKADAISVHCRVSGVEEKTHFLHRILQQKHESETDCKKTPKLSPQSPTAKPPSHYLSHLPVVIYSATSSDSTTAIEGLSGECLFS